MPTMPGPGTRRRTRHREVVATLLLGRLLERGDLDALGVHRADGVLDRAALARGVHALQHDQQAARAAGRRLREQALLQWRLGGLAGSRLEAVFAFFPGAGDCPPDRVLRAAYPGQVVPQIPVHRWPLWAPRSARPALATRPEPAGLDGPRAESRPWPAGRRGGRGPAGARLRGLAPGVRGPLPLLPRRGHLRPLHRARGAVLAIVSSSRRSAGSRFLAGIARLYWSSWGSTR